RVIIAGKPSPDRRHLPADEAGCRGKAHLGRDLRAAAAEQDRVERQPFERSVRRDADDLLLAALRAGGPVELRRGRVVTSAAVPLSAAQARVRRPPPARPPGGCSTNT